MQKRPASGETGPGAALVRQLADAEGRVPRLRPGTEKRIIWAAEPGVRTEVALVYVHGWSASLQELRPVPDLVARALGANLFFTRLTGHGQDGKALAAARPADWRRDAAEAWEVGRHLGRRVILFGTSTGATLVADLAVHLGNDPALAGCVFVSPNFRIASFGAPLLTWPLARHIVHFLLPRIQYAQGHDEQHEYFWTRRYPSDAVLPLAELVNAVRKLDFRQARSPGLFIYNMKDNVVSHRATERVTQAWGGPVQVMHPDIPDDEMHGVHVLAGDILSPSRTGPVATEIIGWARDL